jgi:transposase
MIYRLATASGEGFPVAFIGGDHKGDGSGFWSSCNSRATSRDALTGKFTLGIAQWFVLTSMRLGQTGGNPTEQRASIEQMQEQEALGGSKGGLTTKMHIQAEGMGKPIQFVLTSGQTSDVKGFEQLNQGGKVKPRAQGRPKQRPDYFIGDKAYDSNSIRQTLRRQGTTPVIPKRKNAKRKPRFNRGLYRERNQIERLINRLKQSRCIAIRYEKRAENYLAMLTIAAILIWL